VEVDVKMGVKAGGGADGDLASWVAARIAEERETIARDAATLMERFWDRHWEVDERGDPKQRGYLGVRVRRRGRGVGIEWYKAVPAYRKKGASGPARVWHRYLPRGKGYEYPTSVFRNAQARDWELELAQDLESRFGPLRRRLDVLTRIERQVREYERALGLAKSKNCGESGSGTPQEGLPDATET
jgi:hypothetical protein